MPHLAMLENTATRPVIKVESIFNYRQLARRENLILGFSISSATPVNRVDAVFTEEQFARKESSNLLRKSVICFKRHASQKDTIYRIATCSKRKA